MPAVSFSPLFNGWQGFTSGGIPLSGGLLNTYLAGTSTPAATYTSAAGTIANSNPIVLDGAGRPPSEIWQITGQSYRYVLTDSLGTNPQTYDNIPGIGDADAILRADLGDTANAANGDALIGTKNTATGSTARTQHARNEEDVRSTDFSTLQQAFTAAAGKTLRIFGTNTITATLNASTNTKIVGEPGAVIQWATADISGILCSGVSGVVVEGVHFKQTVAGNAAYTAGVKILNSSRCAVRGCEMEGMQWSGIHLDGATDCDVIGNYVHDSLASSAGDKFDCVLYRSHRNNIGFNRFVGGKHGGVLVQDPLGSGVNVPTRNKVFRNFVGSSTIPCQTYGIVVYLGGTAATYNEVTNNDVENVQGDPAVQLATGTGIYLVGSGLGGCKVQDNNVRNCCQLTTLATNGPAGISITNSPTAEVRVTVSGNTIEACVQGNGLLISTCSSVVADGNTVTIPAANNATGPGGANLAGNALKITNSDNVVVSGGRYICLGSQDSILTLVTDANHADITLSAVSSTAAAQNPFRTAQTGGFTITGYNQIGCNGTTISNAANAVNLSSLVDSSIVGGRYACGTQAALSVNACTGLMVDAANWITTGTDGISYAGTNTGSFFAKSNRFTGRIINGGTGNLVEFFSVGVPTTGTYTIGDRAEERVKAAGAAKGWGRVTNGSANVLGTDWKTEGNL